MRNKHVAIQGSISSFHEIAAKQYFGKDINVLECGTFREVCMQLANNKVDYGLIAIENKVAGTILMNYQLIEEFELNIVGESILPIELFLFVQEGMTLSEIKEIVSHPMALGQCQSFLSGLNDVKILEYKDTALSAEVIKNDPSRKMAVIAGESVGTRFGLAKLTSNICDEKINFTRFYILTKGEIGWENADKASINVRCKNEVGALYEILGVFKDNHINLSKIQSIPLANVPDEYVFHMDLNFKEKAHLDCALNSLLKYSYYFKILGIYRSFNLELAENVTK